MKFAYFPGCSAKASTRELNRACHWLAGRLGIEMTELVDAGCCGSCGIKAANPQLHLTLNARILALAAAQNLEIVTVCDTCQANLQQTARRLEVDSESRAIVVENLRQAGLDYTGTGRVRHLVTILAEEVGLDTLRRHIVNPLTGLKVASFACCHSFRGPGASTDARSRLDDLIALTGATVLPARADGDCCGFHVLMVNEELSARTSAKFLTRCVEMGSDCVVTTSPLCHTALDIYQRNVERAAGREIRMPILHVQQLLALSFGCNPRAVGMDRHLVSTSELLAKWSYEGRATARTAG